MEEKAASKHAEKRAGEHELSTNPSQDEIGDAAPAGDAELARPRVEEPSPSAGAATDVEVPDEAGATTPPAGIIHAHAEAEPEGTDTSPLEPPTHEGPSGETAAEPGTSGGTTDAGAVPVLVGRLRGTLFPSSGEVLLGVKDGHTYLVRRGPGVPTALRVTAEVAASYVRATGHANEADVRTFLKALD